MNTHPATLTIVAALGGPPVLAVPASAQWVDFQADPGRLDAPPELGALDTEEKDYAWGDVDRDGDEDLVVVRKEPWTTTGRRVNVLLLNEGGVLRDRTAELATASSVFGDLGFLTPTNDRDVALADVNGDEWLDVVTAPTLTDNAPRHISHPRVYVNLGEQDGAWLGFRYEEDRIPLMHATAGPRFCAVSAGDVTGDGFPDLFFSDYDSGGPLIFDFNDRLFVNDGQGYFTDETASRMSAQMVTSNFGIANAIADMNGDGVNDVVRLTSLGTPYHVGIAYNDPDVTGLFGDYQIAYAQAPYHTTVGDLNADGLLDIVVADDATDRYLLNLGNNGQGLPQFGLRSFGPQTNVIFAGNIVVEDLDLDGWNDVIIADADVDIPGCSARTFIFHNLANGPDVDFQEQGQVIPFDQLSGVHDVAAMDLDGNGWTDLVLGRCTGTQVWMNHPPVGVAFAYPEGLPDLLPPESPTDLPVELAVIGDASIAAAEVFSSVAGGPFVATPLMPAGGGAYLATLPAAACAERVSFYFRVELHGAGVFRDPPEAPADVHAAVAATGLETILADTIEGDVSAWAVANENLASGAWEQAEPELTIFNGAAAAPGADATEGPGNVQAFVTANGLPGGEASASDVDGGPTHLLSPLVDLEGGDGLITYARWMFSAGGGNHVADELTVAVSNDGGASWVTVADQTSGGTGSAWETASFIVGEHVTPSAAIRVRFTVADQPNNSVTEAGVDDFRVERFLCGDRPGCPADTNGDGTVDVDDLVAVVLDWACTGGCPGDVTGDGVVDVEDLIAVVLSWGPCA